MYTDAASLLKHSHRHTVKAFKTWTGRQKKSRSAFILQNQIS